MKKETLEQQVRESVRQGDARALFEQLGWTVVCIPLPDSALPAWGWGGGRPGDLELVATGLGCRALLHRGPHEFRRPIAMAVARHNPHETVLWVWPDETAWTFGHVDRGPQGNARLQTMVIDAVEPDPMGVAAVRRLALEEVAQPNERDRSATMRNHLREVLGAEELTRAFFQGFRTAHDALEREIVDGPDDDRARHDLCLVVLLRLVFLYFVQREGLLDGDRRYLVRRLREPRTGSYWDEVLRPLFFGALNTPAVERSRLVARLGQIPFLNGGLFEPTPAEVEHPDVCWDDAVWAEVIEGHFERFHFTAVEPSGADEARVVDPEMLGKVFEELMHADARQSSGAFYTPRDTVRRMVDEVLEAYLDDQLGCSMDAALREGREADVRAALRAVTVLDPAVGTGAFLLEMLDAIRTRRERLGDAIGYAELRAFVHDHLFGVDRQPTAVRLCELRLWLVMLGGMLACRSVEPLPNLSHRIAAGDSLLGAAGEGPMCRERTVTPEARAELEALEARVDELQRRYLSAHGDAKHRLRQAMAASERALQIRWLAARKEQLCRRLAPLENLRHSRGLFTETQASDATTASIRALEQRIAAIDYALVDVRAGRASTAMFAYESRFGRVAHRGFDIVITNPPWVRAQRLDSDTRRRLRSRYRTAQNTLWPDAARLGIRTPFGSQPDLSAIFLERSLELLADGGRLCALVPAKLFRSLHGSPLRELLAGYDVAHIEDLSEANGELFDATTYPAVVHVRKARPSSPALVETWRGTRVERLERPTNELGALGGPASPWLFVPANIRQIFEKVERACVPFGTVEGMEPRRGLFTGANDIFIRPAGEFADLLGPAAAPFVRPVLTGSTIDQPTLEILYPYDDAGELLVGLPEPCVDYFEARRERLAGRSDARPALPSWQLFRVRPDTVGPKVAWRDFSVFLEPVDVPADAVPLNTVYYLPCLGRDTEAVKSWMSALPVRAFAYAIAERARGGWRRHFAWVIRMLPVPVGMIDDGFRRAVTASDFGLQAADLDELAAWLEPGEEPQRSAA